MIIIIVVMILFLRPLETAEENASRLAQNPQLSLPFPECCDTKKDSFIECPYCDVSFKLLHCYAFIGVYDLP